jgi:formylglycine-generating enzyme required for sulfatase activity
MAFAKTWLLPSLTLAALTACSSGSGSLGGLPNDPDKDSDDDFANKPAVYQLDLADGNKNGRSDIVGSDDRHAVFVKVSGAESVSLHTADSLGPTGVVESGTTPNSVQSFYIMHEELTQAQWQTLVQQAPGSGVQTSPWNQVKPSGNFGGTGDDLPAYGLSHENIQQLLDTWNTTNEQRGVKLRLPTASEWEYACVGGEQHAGQRYAWGESTSPDGLAEWALVAETKSGNGPRSATSGTANALGLRNMHGNVWEWIGESAAASLRGGSWADPVQGAHVSNRMSIDPLTPYATAGVRLVLEPDEPIPEPDPVDEPDDSDDDNPDDNGDDPDSTP